MASFFILERNLSVGSSAFRTALVALSLLFGGMEHVRANQNPVASVPLCCDGQDCNALPGYKDHLSALVIGVDDYATGQTGLPTLKNAGNDAVEMARVLSQQGYTVRCLKNIGQKAILDEVTALADHISAYDSNPANALTETKRLAVVFFAGHGFGDHNDNYILGSPDGDNITLESMKIPLSLIAIRFAQGASGNYPLLFIFDACRADLSAHRISPDDRATTTAFHQQKVNNGQFPGVVIFSTTGGNFAIDAMAEAKIINNGLFVSKFAALLRFKSLTFGKTYLYTDRSMRSLTHLGVRQFPYNGGDLPFETRIGWRHSNQPASACEATVGDLLDGGFDCDGNDARGKVCARKICTARNRLLRSSLPAQQCLRTLLEHLITDLDTLCSPVEMQVDDQSDIPRIASSEREQVLAGTLASLVRNDERSPEVFREINAASIRNFERLNSVQQAEGTRVSRDALLTKRQTINRKVSAPIDILVPQQAEVKVRNTPNKTSTIMRSAEPGTRLIVDCQSITCTRDWAGVRLDADGETFRGWLPTTEIIALALARDAGPTFPLVYAQGRRDPTVTSLEPLDRKVQETKAQQRLSAKIIVSQHGVNVEDEMRAEARVIHLRNWLVKSGIIAQNIGYAIQTGAAGNEDENAVVRLLILPMADGTP